ncbi:MAG: hypothetical protein KC656_24850, partial [Myxococcales bacterium]|nr:hypothetical protein [Myxococcales bacterium]
MSGRLPDGSVWTLPLVPEVVDGRALRTTWARGRIAELLDDEVRWPGFVARREGLPIALEYGVVSPWSSFVAVDQTPAPPEPPPIVEEIVSEDGDDGFFDGNEMPEADERWVEEEPSAPKDDWADDDAPMPDVAPAEAYGGELKKEKASKPMAPSPPPKAQPAKRSAPQTSAPMMERSDIGGREYQSEDVIIVERDPGEPPPWPGVVPDALGVPEEPRPGTDVGADLRLGGWRRVGVHASGAWEAGRGTSSAEARMARSSVLPDEREGVTDGVFRVGHTYDEGDRARAWEAGTALLRSGGIQVTRPWLAWTARRDAGPWSVLHLGVRAEGGFRRGDGADSRERVKATGGWTLARGIGSLELRAGLDGRARSGHEPAEASLLVGVLPPITMRVPPDRMARFGHAALYGDAGVRGTLETLRGVVVAGSLAGTGRIWGMEGVGPNGLLPGIALGVRPGRRGATLAGGYGRSAGVPLPASVDQPGIGRLVAVTNLRSELAGAARLPVTDRLYVDLERHDRRGLVLGLGAERLEGRNSWGVGLNDAVAAFVRRTVTRAHAELGLSYPALGLVARYDTARTSLRGGPPVEYLLEYGWMPRYWEAPHRGRVDVRMGGPDVGFQLALEGSYARAGSLRLPDLVEPDLPIVEDLVLGGVLRIPVRRLRLELAFRG